jgi:hypothetical protein
MLVGAGLEFSTLSSSFSVDGTLMNNGSLTSPNIPTPFFLCVWSGIFFSLSLNFGIFPDLFKTVRVVPIFKSGDKTQCDNYKPISLVKSLSKILKKIVQINLVNHLELNNLLYKHQYGFLHAKSSEHNLIHVINNIALSLNDGDLAIGVFLDLRKAFDVSDHNIRLTTGG